jgi:hypothetical protein
MIKDIMLRDLLTQIACKNRDWLGMPQSMWIQENVIFTL